MRSEALGPRRPTHARVPRWCVLGVVLVAVVLGAGCGDSTGTNASATTDRDATVTIKAFTFAPDPLVVERGSTIKFINDDGIDHTVTAGTRAHAAPERFDHTLSGAGAAFELTLDKAGTYRYFCRIHPGPGMTATIIVR